MKQLLKTFNRFQIQRTSGVYFTTPKSLFTTSNNNNTSNESEDVISARNKVLDQEKAYFNSLSEKEKKFYQAYRISLVKSINESWNDPKAWWNKVKTLTSDEIEMLPEEYLIKFGNFIRGVEDLQKVSHVE